MHTICYVEDEINLSNVVKAYLEKAGYNVVYFSKGGDAINYIGHDVSLWILDVMLEDDINGYNIIKEIRQKDANVPVIFTSARDQDLDRILGLELGSDDYLAKPFSSKELVLRVNNIMKRVYQSDINNTTIIYKDYSIDTKKRSVKDKDKELKLTTLEFDLLLMFIKNMDKSFTREEILNIIWGDDYFGTDRVVDDLVRRLRKKMKKLNLNTIYGYGYRLS